MDKQYAWGMRYVDELVCRDDVTPERLYATQDANFNVTAIIDTTGAVQERFLYDPYGNGNVLSGSWTSTTDAYAWTERFTGQFFDIETELYYYRARYYHLNLGRFTSRDPIGYRSDVNLYEYVQSKPIINMDPFGEDCCGVDITQKLLAIDFAAQGQWNALPWYDKALLDFKTTAPPFSINLWDIVGMTSQGIGRGAPCNSGTGKCSGTVTVSGHCHWQRRYSQK